MLTLFSDVMLQTKHLIPWLRSTDAAAAADETSRAQLLPPPIPGSGNWELFLALGFKGAALSRVGFDQKRKMYYNTF